MTSALRLTIPLAIVAAAAAGVFLSNRAAVRPLTAAELRGEWVQDPDFLQHAGADLDAQKAEIDRWENYEFAFDGARLTGWRLLHDDATRDPAGWTQGKGAHFACDYTLAPADHAVALSFTDHASAAQQATLAWDGDKIAVTLGDRKFRLKKAPAENLRIRKLIAQP